MDTSVDRIFKPQELGFADSSLQIKETNHKFRLVWTALRMPKFQGAAWALLLNLIDQMPIESMRMQVS